MLRLFKLYSLYMDNIGFSPSQKSCKCEKLPRAMLHVPVNRFNVCEICGQIRRPRTCSSDEEEKLDAERQKILLQRRHAEEAAHSNKTARFKVAVKGKKPQAKSNSRRIKNDDWARTEGGGLGEAGDGDGDGPKETSKVGRRQQEPSAPPPSSPSPAPSGSPCEDISSSYPRRRLIYDDQFVKKFIPLKGPITDPSGGAISKRSGSIWGAGNPHIGRAQGLLSNDKLQGGGSASSKSKGRYTESQLASQFPPFDEYDGPSEDAFVVENARRMLNRPNSLYMEPRPDLPNNRIGSHGSSLGRIWLAPQTMPSAAAPKIPEPPSEPCTNKSPLSDYKADTKEINKISESKFSPIFVETKSEEQHPGLEECEDILQSLGLIELSNEIDETIINELTNDDVVSSNKTMTDEEYSEMLSKKWGANSRKSIIIGELKAINERISSIEKRISVKYQENWDHRERSKDLELAKLSSRKFKSHQERAYPVSRNSSHRVETSSRIGTPLSLVDNPKELHFIKQINRNTRSVESKLIKSGDRISETKCLKCNQCQRPVRIKAENVNLRKISKNSELEPSKLKSESKKRPCPVHSDIAKRLLCWHKIINNSWENCKTQKFVSKTPEFKIEKTVKTIVFTKKPKTLYKVNYMSVDLPKLHFASYVSQVSGILVESYVQNQPFVPFLVSSVDDPSTLEMKVRAKAVWPSIRSPRVYVHQKKRLIPKEASKRVTLETEFKGCSQEQNQKKPGSPVPVPEINQDSENERKMIKAIAEHFRSNKKSLKKKSRGF